jgi:hypothetical protein
MRQTIKSNTITQAYVLHKFVALLLAAVVRSTTLFLPVDFFCMYVLPYLSSVKAPGIFSSFCSKKMTGNVIINTIYFIPLRFRLT